MSEPRPDSRPNHLHVALEHARRLSDARAEGAPYGVAWSAQAAHVGDLTVLALAMRD